MASTALVTAGVAAALLVVTLGVDVAMTTTYALDVWTGTAWRELVRDPYVIDRQYRGPEQALVTANASEDVRFRLRAENGYPWSKDGGFRVLHNGEEVASGSLDLPARSSDEAEFSIPAARLIQGAGQYEPKPVGSTDTFVSLYVEVDDKPIFAQYPPYFTLREVRS